MTNTKYGRKSGIVLSLDEMFSACALDDEPDMQDSESGTEYDAGGEPGSPHGIDLEELGLPENATLGEIREAVRVRTIDRLGLSEDATDEEILEATNAHREVELAEAIESGDYHAWKELMAQDPGSAHLLEIVTEENFQNYKEMQENLWMADELAEELGLSAGTTEPDEEEEPEEDDYSLAEI